MTDSFSSAALRGAVDLSRLATPTPVAGGSGSVSATSGARLVTDADVPGLVNESMNVPVLLVLWASSMPASRDHVADVVQAAAAYEGRFVVAEADIEASPALGQAFQVRVVPLVAAILQGRPAPLYEGAQPPATLTELLGEMVKVAVANGMTGRAATPPVAQEPDLTSEPEPELPPHLAAAYDALNAGDLAEAQRVLQDARTKNPGDEEVRLLLGQVGLMVRTRDADPVAVRAAAAQAPDDVAAQAAVADLDLLGGHVEDAFARLLDLVKRTSGAERDQAREHLVGLFDLVGADDERVRPARQALMRALF